MCRFKQIFKAYLNNLYFTLFSDKIEYNLYQQPKIITYLGVPLLTLT